MSKRDYYEILGLDKSATQAEIKTNYRRLAMQFHPDRNKEKGAEDKFKEVGEAYEILSDSIKKQQYDQFGHSGLNNHPQHHNSTHTWNFDAGNVDINDILNSVFQGGMFNQQRQQINIITISLSDAYKGIAVQLDNNRTLNIPAGIRTGTRFSIDNKLYRVDIQPHVKFKRSNDDLLVDIEISCIEAMVGLNCLLDHLDNAKITFSVPAGIQNGQVVRLSGKGMKNPETDSFGDLLIRVTITIPKSLSTQEQNLLLKTFQHRTDLNI